LRSYVSNKIPGFDFAGTVVEAQHGFAPGDKVFGTMPPMEGTLAEYISVPLDQICYMPKNYSFRQAAALPLVGLTAVQCLQPHITSSSSVLIIGGSGGTGHVALQVARNLGAEHITTVCSTKNKNFCQECGATHIVDYAQGKVLEDLQQSPGCPFNVILDCVTSADPRDQKMNYPELIQTKEHGLVADNHVYRRLGGRSPDWIRAGLERTVGLHCWKDKHEKLFWIRFPKSAPELKQLQEWAEADKLMPRVESAYDFTPEGVQGAFDAILGRHVQGKVIIQVKDDGEATQESSK